ncbi:MAG TPA: Mrp/NBP35 family ATP-binding protein [Longimicrobiales bacterium]|nr:Mrp/NBP35 family ATP-binding protein [Longimicrobiales bacterium]
MIDKDRILESVRTALAAVRHPQTGEDVVAGGKVQDLTVSDEGVVRFLFLLGADDPGTLVRESRAAVERIDGVERARIDVRLPKTTGDRPEAAAGDAPPARRPGTVPAPQPAPGMVPGIHHVIAVSSGKGGVGKSTVAANLAAALVTEGAAVGLLDADVYGPNIPLLFGETGRPRVTGTRGQERIVPMEAHGVRLMSLGFLMEADQPAIMRGPLVSGILKQFLEQVEWGELDFLIVDMPPGTGDAQLSLAQTIAVDGAVMVTTPQAVSTADVRRGIRMWERVRTPVLGIVENMAGFVCTSCGEHHDIFGAGGGVRLAEEMGVEFLGGVPLDTEVRRSGDDGAPTVLVAADSPAAEAFRAVAARVRAAVEAGVHVGA